jgi:hypothetical protein
VVDAVRVDRPIPRTVLTDKTEEFADPQSLITYTGLGPVFVLEETAETRAAYFSGPPLTEHPQKQTSFLLILSLFSDVRSRKSLLISGYFLLAFSADAGYHFGKYAQRILTMLAQKGR